MYKSIEIGKGINSRNFIEVDSCIMNPLSDENKQKPGACFRFQGLTDGWKTDYSLNYNGLEVSTVTDGGFKGPHELYSLKFSNVDKGLKLNWNFRFFDAPGYECFFEFSSDTAPIGTWLEKNREDRLDIIPFATKGAEICLGEFRAATDHHNEFVIIKEQVVDKKAYPLYLDGNVLRLKRKDGSGVWLYKISPSSIDRRDKIRADFRIEEDGAAVLGWGIEPHDVLKHKHLKSNSLLVIPFTGGNPGAMTAARNFFKHYWEKAYNLGANVTVNPWGGGGVYLWKHMKENWVIEEIKAAGKMGATHYQIDDGWQQGGTLLDIRRGIPLDREFWTINKDKFPHGFDRIIEVAKKCDVKLGLWFCPDYNREYQNWEEELEILLEMYEHYGFEAIKIDGTCHRSYLGEENYDNLLRHFHRLSHGKTYFNLDTTADVRKGYLYSTEFGPVFVANRYPYYPIGDPVKYYPDNTLRNFWKMVHFIPPHLIQVEIPNVRYNPDDYVGNFDKGYADDDNRRPSLYDPRYCAMIAFFGAPLLWLQPTRTDQRLINEYSEIIQLHKRYRDEIVSGTVMPVGDVPNGRSFTGFLSIGKSSGIILVFRELTEKSQAVIPIPVDAVKVEKIISNTKTNAVIEDGVLKIELNKRRSFALLSYLN